ncbi:MAG TPA: hypothetical protein PKW55_05975 [Spirochaetota bacterium]|nr:hypothetical protein [Spirochaetota bacterium]HOM38432.1 hypothetical protein [Spirochaetota bacterium]HPQ48971.1 hypothetical protein [Spirochaetota bacterium]
MGRGICISDLEQYLKELSKTYNCGGIWICKKFGKRLSFIAGVRPVKLIPPISMEVNKDYVLFIEDDSNIDENERRNILNKIHSYLLFS